MATAHAPAAKQRMQTFESNLRREVKLTALAGILLLPVWSESLPAVGLVEFSETNVTVLEGEGLILPLLIEPRPERWIDVTVTETGGTASKDDLEFRCYAGPAMPETMLFRYPTSFPCLRMAFDGVGEGEETLELALSDVSGGYELGSKTSLTIHIVDVPLRVNAGVNEPPIEAGGPWTLSLWRTGQLDLPFSFQYMLDGGTAIAGRDFDPQMGTIAFASGEANKLVELPNPVRDNFTVDGPRTMLLTLTNPTHRVKFGSTSLPIPIQDDEVANAFVGLFGVSSLGPSHHRSLVLCQQPDGKFIVQSRSVFDSLPVIVRLNPDGSMDHLFQLPPAVRSLQSNRWERPIWMPYPDGRHLVGMPEAERLVRLKENGDLDNTFEVDPELAARYRIVPPYLPLPDGGALVNIEDRNQLLAGRTLVRLQPNGQFDGEFNRWLFHQDYVSHLVPHSEGVLVVDGRWIRRCHLDGTSDDSFHVVENPGVTHIVVQPDEKILLLGEFGQFDGEAFTNLVRLLPDGRIDRSFQSSSHPPYPNNGVLVLLEGDLVAVAAIDLHGWGTSVPFSLVRYHPDGSFDRCLPLGLDGYLDSIHLTPDGRVLVTGFLSSPERSIQVPPIAGGIEALGMAVFDLDRVDEPGIELGIVERHAFESTPTGIQLTEDNGTEIAVRVLRLGVTAGSLPLRLLVRGSAVQGEDFRLENVPSEFAPGEVEKVFTIRVLNDTVAEPDEEFFIAVEGGGNARYSAISVRILDDEPGGWFTRAPEVPMYPDEVPQRHIHFTAPADDDWVLEASSDLQNWTRDGLELVERPYRESVRWRWIDTMTSQFPSRYYRAVKR